MKNNAGRGGCLDKWSGKGFIDWMKIDIPPLPSSLTSLSHETQRSRMCVCVQNSYIFPVPVEVQKRAYHPRLKVLKVCATEVSHTALQLIST